MLTRVLSSLSKPLIDLLRSTQSQGTHRITFLELMDIDWKLYGQHLRGHQAEWYRRKAIRETIEEEFGADLAAVDFDDLVMKDFWRARQRAELQDNTINRDRGVIRAIFNRSWERKRHGVVGGYNAREWVLPLENPASAIPTLDEREFDRKRAVTPEQWDSFKAYCSIRLLRQCQMAVWTGLSENDLVKLTKSKSVNRITGCLEGVRLKTITPKNPNGEWFRLKITDSIRALIDEATGDTILDFQGHEKEIIRTVRKWMKGPPIYNPETELFEPREYFCFSDLRKSAGVGLEKHGVKRSTIQRLYAHKYGDTTDRYLFSTDPQVDEAMRKLEQIFK